MCVCVCGEQGVFHLGTYRRVCFNDRTRISEEHLDEANSKGWVDQPARRGAARRSDGIPYGESEYGVNLMEHRLLVFKAKFPAPTAG